MTALDDAAAKYNASLTAPVDARPAAYKQGLTDGYALGVIDGKASVVVPPVVTPPVTTPVTTPAGNTVTRNGITRTLAFSEDFTTDAALGKVQAAYPNMGYYDGFKDTTGHGLYSPAKTLTVHDSSLDAFVHIESGQPLVACVMPDNYTPRTYGRFDIRYKTTGAVGSGFKFVGIMWPSSDTWNDGEIDWPEADLLGTPRPANAVPGTYKNGAMTFAPPTEQFAKTDSSDWHVASIEWTKTALSFFWDDVLVASITDATKIPTKPMRLTLQAETSTNINVPANSAGGHVLIDWVRIYS